MYRDLHEELFKGFYGQNWLQDLTPRQRAAAEAEKLAQLSNSDINARISAINTLAVLESKKAVPGLLKIATTRGHRDSRDSWMAIRALGFIGDRSAVPDLVHLTYHFDRNVKSWAQISLVRITGENFADDLANWIYWWRQQGGNPPISEQPIRWFLSEQEKSPIPERPVSSTMSENASAARADNAIWSRNANILANMPYWQVMTDFAQRNGMTVSSKSNDLFRDTWERRRHVLLVETHDGKPFLPLSDFARTYPHASEGLKKPEGFAIVGDVKYVFVDFSQLLKGTVLDSADAALQGEQAFVSGNFQNLSVLADMAQRKGMTVTSKFTMHYDKWLQEAKGHVLFIESQNEIPTIPLPVIEAFYPNASEGLKSSKGVVGTGNTKIVFVDFSRLPNIPLEDARSASPPSGAERIEGRM